MAGRVQHLHLARLAQRQPRPLLEGRQLIAPQLALLGHARRLAGVHEGLARVLSRHLAQPGKRWGRAEGARHHRRHLLGHLGEGAGGAGGGGRGREEDEAGEVAGGGGRRGHTLPPVWSKW